MEHLNKGAMCSGSYLLKRTLYLVWRMFEVGGRNREDSCETIEVFQVRDDSGFD